VQKMFSFIISFYLYIRIYRIHSFFVFVSLFLKLVLFFSPPKSDIDNSCTFLKMSFVLSCVQSFCCPGGTYVRTHHMRWIFFRWFHVVSLFFVKEIRGGLEGGEFCSYIDR